MIKNRQAILIRECGVLPMAFAGQAYFYVGILFLQIQLGQTSLQELNLEDLIRYWGKEIIKKWGGSKKLARMLHI